MEVQLSKTAEEILGEFLEVYAFSDEFKLKQGKWFQGDLSWKLHDAQRLIKERLDKISGQLFVANCSRQWGKSFLMVTECVSLALKKKRARIKYATAFLTDLEEFILPTFQAVLEDCPESIRPIYKAKGSKWIFSNGSEIKLVGLDKKPNGLRGNVIDMIVLDECGFIQNLSQLYKNVIIPATTHRPNCKVILISTPPTTPAHDFGEFIQRAEAEGSYAKFDIYTNPMIDQATIQRLMRESGGESSTTWRREYLCELLTDEDSQLVSEWNEKYVVPTVQDPYYQFYHLYEGMDLGVKDFTVVLFGYYDFRRATLVIQDEIKMNGPTLTTQIIHDRIKAKEQSLWPERKVYRRISDNNNPQLIQDLAILHKMSFVTTDKDRLETMLNELRLMVAKGQIEVDPRCSQLSGCLKYGVWDSKKKKFAKSQVYGHYDALAALIYLVRNLDKHANPVPATYGLDTRNAVIKTPRWNSEGAKLMGQIFNKPTQRNSR